MSCPRVFRSTTQDFSLASVHVTLKNQKTRSSWLVLNNTNQTRHTMNDTQCSSLCIRSYSCVCKHDQRQQSHGRQWTWWTKRMVPKTWTYFVCALKCIRTRYTFKPFIFSQPVHRRHRGWGRDNRSETPKTRRSRSTRCRWGEVCGAGSATRNFFWIFVSKG